MSIVISVFGWIGFLLFCLMTGGIIYSETAKWIERRRSQRAQINETPQRCNWAADRIMKIEAKMRERIETFERLSSRVDKHTTMLETIQHRSTLKTTQIIDVNERLRALGEQVKRLQPTDKDCGPQPPVNEVFRPRCITTPLKEFDDNAPEEVPTRGQCMDCPRMTDITDGKPTRCRMCRMRIYREERIKNMRRNRLRGPRVTRR